MPNPFHSACSRAWPFEPRASFASTGVMYRDMYHHHHIPALSPRQFTPTGRTKGDRQTGAGPSGSSNSHSVDQTHSGGESDDFHFESIPGAAIGTDIRTMSPYQWLAHVKARVHQVTEVAADRLRKWTLEDWYHREVNRGDSGATYKKMREKHSKAIQDWISEWAPLWDLVVQDTAVQGRATREKNFGYIIKRLKEANLSSLRQFYLVSGARTRTDELMYTNAK